MRKSDGLVTISRRHVCGGLAGCIGLVALANCSSDGSNANQPDAAEPPIDAPGGGACTTGAIDVGAPTTFVTNKPVYFASGNFFVVRDSGGLYALTARCTHEGATTVVSGSDFFCPRHGAQFDFDGNVVSGPVSTGLRHFAMCMLANGHVGVNTSQVVTQSQRFHA
jgi:nitrite reductase/ring-hydroxylating ferredoxin subunit